MPLIRYIEASGTTHEVELAPGTNLMMGAIQNNIRGIDGECGGCLSCATCHVYLDDDWFARVPPPDAMEDEMLEEVAEARRPGSRLACQVLASDAIDGMPVRMPLRQA